MLKAILATTGLTLLLRRLAAALAILVATGIVLGTAAVYALAAAHGALTSEVGPIYASLIMTGALGVVGLFTLMGARKQFHIARNGRGQVWSKSQRYLAMTAWLSSARWMIPVLRTARGIPWRNVGIVAAAVALAALLWRHLRAEYAPAVKPTAAEAANLGNVQS